MGGGGGNTEGGVIFALLWGWEWPKLTEPLLFSLFEGMAGTKLTETGSSSSIWSSESDILLVASLRAALNAWSLTDSPNSHSLVLLWKGSMDANTLSVESSMLVVCPSSTVVGKELIREGEGRGCRGSMVESGFADDSLNLIQPLVPIVDCSSTLLGNAVLATKESSSRGEYNGRQLRTI